MKLMKDSIFREEGGVLKKFDELGGGLIKKVEKHWSRPSVIPYILGKTCRCNHWPDGQILLLYLLRHIKPMSREEEGTKCYKQLQCNE